MSTRSEKLPCRDCASLPMGERTGRKYLCATCRRASVYDKESNQWSLLADAPVSKPDAARKGAPITIAADTYLRIRLPSALLVEIKEAAGEGGLSAWVREACEARLRGR